MEITDIFIKEELLDEEDKSAIVSRLHVIARQLAEDLRTVLVPQDQTAEHDILVNQSHLL